MNIHKLAEEGRTEEIERQVDGPGRRVPVQMSEVRQTLKHDPVQRQRYF